MDTMLKKMTEQEKDIEKCIEYLSEYKDGNLIFKLSFATVYLEKYPELYKLFKVIGK